LRGVTPSARFSSSHKHEEENLSKSKPSKFEEKNELEKKYNEIHRDKEVKRKLISAYGPRIA